MYFSLKSIWDVGFIIASFHARVNSLIPVRSLESTESSQKERNINLEALGEVGFLIYYQFYSDFIEKEKNLLSNFKSNQLSNKV